MSAAQPAQRFRPESGPSSGSKSELESGSNSKRQPGPVFNDSSVSDLCGAKKSSIAAAKAQKSFVRVSGRWLRWQCQLLNDVRFAAVVDATGLSEGAGITANNIVSQIGTPQQPLIVVGPTDQNQQSTREELSCWQIPISFPSRALCVIFHIGSLKAQEQTAVDRLLRWGVLSLTAWLSDAQVSPAPSMPPIALMLEQKNLEQAAARWVDHLQSKTNAARVSLGWFDNGSTRLLAVSGLVALDVRREFPRALAAALGECIQASVAIVYPSEGESSVELPGQKNGQLPSEFNNPRNIELHKHQTVYERGCKPGGKHRVISLPLMFENSAVGAVLLELDAKHDLKTITSQVMDEAAFATPVLSTLSEHKPGLRAMLSRRFHRIRTVLFNPTTVTQKCITASLFVISLIALLYPFSYSTSVRGEIHGADRQVLAAAHAGYLKSVSARAGDTVTTGQVLAKFDHTQLQLERDTWTSELTRIDAALTLAMSTRDRSAIGRLHAEQSSANAEVELIDYRITQSDVVAPFDGILVSGDLDDRLGSAVVVGESLFQIASLNDYTLRLDVPEQHAAKIKQGSTGDMRFAAFPSLAFSFSVDSMVPVAVPENGTNVFRMQASLTGDTTKIRPGMSGVAKVTVGQRAWGLRGVDFLRHQVRYWWWSLGA